VVPTPKQLPNNDFVLIDLVDHAMFVVDAPRPVTANPACLSSYQSMAEFSSASASG
jgi:hypothetical protein